eukprot:m51a1_g1025 hypothetical protein (362) ;mRNA; f:651041-652820
MDTAGASGYSGTGPAPGGDEVAPMVNRAVAAGVSGVSLLGCLVVLVLAIATGRARFLSWRCICYSALGEAFFTSTLLACFFAWDSIADSDALCNAAGFLHTVSTLQTNLWVLFMSAVLLQLVRPSGGPKRLPGFRAELAWGTATLALSCLFAAYPVAHLGGADYLRVRAGWCHVAPRPRWGRLVPYGVTWVVIALTAALYACAWTHVRRLRRSGASRSPATYSDERRRRRARRVWGLLQQVWAYPLILAIVWVPSTIARAVDAVRGYDGHWTSLVASATVPLNGALQLACFLLTSGVAGDCASAACRAARGKKGEGDPMVGPAWLGYGTWSTTPPVSPFLLPISPALSPASSPNLSATLAV